jgi:sialate O-acetylesterase
MGKSCRIAIAALVTAALTDFAAGAAPPLLAPMVQDHAVLQRGKPIPLWGAAKPGVSVTVALGLDVATITADGEGRWRTVLPALPAGGPYTLLAKSSDGETQTIRDVLIGDVFLCSGQSNMELPVSVASNYNADIAGATNASIRLFHVQRTSSTVPRTDFAAGTAWAVTSPASIPDFSAACYNFGKALQPVVHVPVGLIESAWGGSVIQAWMSQEKVAKIGGYGPQIDILSAYAASPQEGEAAWRKFARNWWATHDPASAATPPWRDPAYSDKAWKPIAMRGSWRNRDASTLKTFDGIVWLRTTVELTEDQAKQAATLSLGPIDAADTVWIDGNEIAYGHGYDVPRNYSVPAGTLHAGENLIAIGIYGGAGPLAPADRMALELADGTAVPLTRSWRYKLSVTADETGPISGIPWLNQYGLTDLYNGMIRPLGETPLRGIVWYQGESNSGEPQEYRRLLAAMIADWRRQFGAETPFIVVQLPNFGPMTTKPEPSNWAEMREVQRELAQKTPHTGLVTTIDIGQTDNIHPTNKQELGRRIALVAERLVYGMKVTDAGPEPISAVRHDAKVTVRFVRTVSPLTVYGANRPVGFQLCDEENRCQYADAKQRSGEIELSVPKSFTATRVRYCWGDSPLCNVYNAAGLPAGPFELAIANR